MIHHLKRVMDTFFPSISKSYRYLRDYLSFKIRKPYQTIFGFQLYGDAKLDTSRAESCEIEIFSSLVSEVDIIVDIGSNVGLFTCIAAQAQKKVLAIEPNFYNLQLLYRNLVSNNFTNVEIFPIALSDYQGILPLYGSGQGASLIHQWGGIRSNYQTLVSVNTLDNLIDKRFIDSRILIKIDVEGNEFNVLKGATSLLVHSPAPIWIIEHGLTEHFDNCVNPHFLQLFDLFWDLGYEAFTIDQELRLVKSDDVIRWMKNKEKDFGSINYLFKRKG